ncbi:MAG: PD-(D/E)XK nuclease family protein [bacterium]
MERADQIKTLFFTKSRELHECEQKYFWRYHRWLIPKTKSPPLMKGGYAHAVIHKALTLQRESQLSRDNAVAIALVEEEDRYPLSEEHMGEAKGFSLALWYALEDVNVVESELTLNLNMGDGWVWKAKLDSIIAEPDGLYQGEYKTTANYASNLKRLYHSGIQPFIYLNVAKRTDWDLLGTKMYIVDKKKSHQETVIATPEQLAQAQRYMEETVRRVEEVERRGTYHRNRTQCVTLLSECPYRSLCLEKAQEKYVEDVVQLMYDVENPLAHYGEEGS